MLRPTSSLLTAAAAVAALLATARAQESKLHAEAQRLLDATVRSADVPWAKWDEVYNTAVAVHGSMRELVAALEAIAKSSQPDAVRRQAWRGLVHCQHRTGNLAAALHAADDALRIARSDDLAFRRGQLLDALDRIDDAVTEFEHVAAESRDAALQARARLRIALLRQPGPEATAAKAGQPPAKESPLFVHASAPDQPPATRNNAAVVLALLGRPREAMRLFVPGGEGTERFRQEVRLAEWGLAATEPKAAQQHAWQALRAATVKRDRLYALTLLVEAHRVDASLPALIERFAATPDLDAESRHTWIDLLRESARVDEALALFRAGSERAFTPEMRRELLAICREAGRDDELIRTYDELIRGEPEAIEWRVGLSRHWLEQGKQKEATAVWQSYVEQGRSADRWLFAAEATRDLGLDDLAAQFAGRALQDERVRMPARLFLFDFEEKAGRIDKALEQLEAFDKEAPADAAGRVQLAESFERIGKKKRAIEVLEGIRTVRGKELAEEDLEIRLAWMYSETGDEKTALERYRGLWNRVESPARRRQIEDRLIAVASRLGVLADLAVELEQKLTRGQADAKDAGLLVRLYLKVNDPVSAAEVIDEHLKAGGRDPLAALNDKAQIYLQGKDYFRFEQTIKQLIERDKENRGDHMRSLAMSNLERGRPQEAREVLVALANEESPTDAAEFEAGVLSLAGLHAEAERVYRKGIAAHPERIDTNLLLGNTLRSLGQTAPAIGMFQYLAEFADKDDLFTVAIDGVLNMRARPAQIRHALRITLERIAGNFDKTYLYQLAADLQEELNDSAGRMRALEGALPGSNEQRGSILRELMDLAQGTGNGGYAMIGGSLVQQRLGGDPARRLAYGRRLVGLGDAVPPQVFLELGDAFLRANQVGNAAKTFARARDLPDYAAFQRQVAESFERAGFLGHALVTYERAMASQGLDDVLLVKAGQIDEILGHADRAAELYRRGLEVLLARFPLSGTAAPSDEKLDPWDDSRSFNRTSFDTNFGPLRDGFQSVATAAQFADFAAAQRALLDRDLAAVKALPANGERREAEFPRVHHRADLLRRFALRRADLATAHDLDLALLAVFPADKELLPRLVAERLELGYAADARQLVEQSPCAAEVRTAANGKLGASARSAGRSLADVAARLMPALIEGRDEDLVRDLRDAELTAAADDMPRLKLLLTAALFVDDDASIVRIGRFLMRACIKNAKVATDYTMVDGLLRRVRPSLDRASFELVVTAFAEAASENKEVFRRLTWTFLDLQRQIGRPIVATAVLQEQMDKCLPAEPYMLYSLLELVPPEDRVQALRKVWPKVPPTDRPGVAGNLLRLYRGEIPRDAQDFVLSAIEEALQKVEVQRLITVVANLQMRGDKNNAFLQRLIELVAKRRPDDVQVAGLAAVTSQRANAPDAFERLQQALSLLAQAPNDTEHKWQVRSVATRLVEAFVPAATERFVQEVDKAAAGAGNAALFVTMRAQAFDKVGDFTRKVEALERGVQADPDDDDLLGELQREYSRRGDQKHAIELLRRMCARNGRDYLQNQLRSTLLARHDAVGALAVGKKAAVDGPDHTDESAKKLAPASAKALREAGEAGNGEQFATIYRRLWREYTVNNPVEDGGGGRALRYRRGVPLWPDDTVAKDEERSRGGLDQLREAAVKPDQDTKAKTLYDGVADYGFGFGVLAAQAAMAEPENLQHNRALVRGLQRAAVKAQGETAVGAWRDAAASGRAGRLDQALLLSWFEDHADRLAPADRDLLRGLVPLLDALDGEQLRAFARLHGKLGELAPASRIWQWVACTQSSSRYYFMFDEGDNDAHSLLPEIRQLLTGKELEATVAAILRRNDPGDSPYELDGHLALVFETWLQVVGAEAAAQRCRGELEQVFDRKQGLRRRAALPAARLLAASGDAARAVEALEVALCAFPDLEPADDDEDFYYYRFGRDSSRPSHLAATDAVELFPGAAAPATDAFAERAAVAMVQWHAAKRLDPDAARVLAGALVQQLHAAAKDAAARPLLELLAGLGNAAAQHMLLDCARLLGDEARAFAIEGELLAAQSLHPERVADVVARVQAARGDEAAVALGLQVVSWAPHPQLVERLLGLVRAAGRTADEQALGKLRDANAAAAKELGATW